MKNRYLTVFLCSIAMFPTMSMGSVTDKYGIASPLATDTQKRIFSRIFDIELWSQSYPESYDQDLTIRIIFATRVSRSNVIDFMVEEAQEIHGFTDVQMEQMAKTVAKSIECDPRADSVMDFNYQPGVGIEVTCDGNKSEVALADGPYSEFLLDIFLHEKSEYPGLSKKK